MSSKKLIFYWLYPIALCVYFILPSCNDINEPYVSQTVEYVSDNWKYEVPSDTIDFGDGDYIYRNKRFEGYVLTTTTDDFQSVIMGDSDIIDSLKCIEYKIIKSKQVELDKLRDLKNCD